MHNKFIFVLLFLLSPLCLNAQMGDAVDTLETSSSIQEAIIQADRSSIKVKGERFIVDLVSIVKEKPISSLFDALRYLPGVTTRNDKISLIGSSSVTILINGELSSIPTSSLFDMLQTIPVERLKNVEIMYSAPPKYHVNGAVINIVLKSPTPSDGLKGQMHLGYNQSHFGSLLGGAAASFAVGNWMFDVNYSLKQDKPWYHEESYSNHLYQDTRSMIYEDNRRISNSLSNTLNASIGYKSTNNSVFRLAYSGQIIPKSERVSFTEGTLGQFQNTAFFETPMTLHNISSRYSSSFGLVIGGEILRYIENKSQHLISLFPQNDLAITSNKQDIERYLLYLDQTHEIKGWNINYGMKYQHSNDQSIQSFSLPSQPGFNNDLRESIVDAYLGFEHSSPDGLSISVSAEEEYYKSAIGAFWNTIPQLGISYSPSSNSLVQLSFNTLRIYPSFWELHGGVSYLNSYSIVLGNPNLQPYLSYSGQLGYLYKKKYMISLYCQYDNKAFQQLPYQSPEELKLVYQTLNMDYSRLVGANLYIPLKLRFYNSVFSVNVFHQHDKASQFHSSSFDKEKVTISSSLKNTFNIINRNLSLSLDCSYISPSLQGIADLSSMWAIDAGVKWSFGKNQCCQLNCVFNDVFNTWSPTMTIKHNEQQYQMNIYDMTRVFKISFVYKYNGFKQKQVSIDSSRFGIGN